MTAPRLVARAEAVPGLGAGHVARQLALAQAWVDRGGTATLRSDHLPAFWQARFVAEGVTCIPTATGWRGAEPAGPGDWAVVDGYDLSAAERHAGREALGHLLVVDDHGLSPVGPADVLVDQNLGARAADYAHLAPAPSSGAPGPHLLLGTRYALLRREFRAGAAAVAERAGGPVGRVAVGFGGAPTAEVRAGFGDVAAALAGDGLDVVVLEGVDVAVALAGVDLVVSAAGTITWELCALGLPTVLVPVADNQLPVAARMAEAGAAEVVGAGADPAAIVAAARRLVGPEAADRRQQLAGAAHTLVDGLGAVRTVTHLRAGALILRPVVAADAELLWGWANDAEVRRQGFSPAPIPWDDHVAWLRGRLADPGSALYVASDEDGPVGHVRFAPAATPADGLEIGVNLAPDRRGEHLGAALIEAGVRRVGLDLGAAPILARIRPTNGASRRAFVAADFDADGTGSSGGETWLRYTRHRHGAEPGSDHDG